MILGLSLCVNTMVRGSLIAKEPMINRCDHADKKGYTILNIVEEAEKYHVSYYYKCS